MNTPWFRFFASDWLSGTLVLSCEERGAYITLIAMMYDRGGAITNDIISLARSCCVTNSKMRKLIDSLQRAGKIVVQDGMISNQRMDKETEWRRRARFSNHRFEDSHDRNHRHHRLRSARLSQARQLDKHTKREWAAMLILFPNCVRCGSQGELQKDHIVPIHAGGSDGIDNLQPLCPSCNHGKSNGEDFRAKIRPNFKLELESILGKNAKFINDANVQNAQKTCDIPDPYSKKPKRASCIRRHALPDDFALNEADIASTREVGWSDAKIASELVRFRNHAHANGRLQVDWHAAWRNWVNSPFQQTGPPRVNGHAAAAPRPGSREDRAERTANALAQLRRQAGFNTDESGRGGPACDDLVGFLPIPKPAGS